MRDRRRRAAAALALALCLLAGRCGGGPTTRPTPTPRGPQLLCPASFSVTGVTGTSQQVFYPAPVLASGTTPVTIVCSPLSGTSFPPGDTVVTCTATDSFNQTGSCTFSVSLTPLTLNAMSFVAFGDSVTEGENSLTMGGISFLFIDTPNAYPTQLEAMLNTDFPGQGATVINEGVSGELATEGEDRLSSVLTRHQPEALLLLEGYNDLGDPDAVQDVADALQDMVQTARAAGVQPVFVSTLTPGRAGERMRDPSAILQVNALIRLMVQSEGAILVDSFNTFIGREATLVSDDGLHLTAAGNTVLAETFLAAIRNAVTSGNLPYFLYTAPPGSVDK